MFLVTPDDLVLSSEPSRPFPSPSIPFFNQTVGSRSLGMLSAYERNIGVRNFHEVDLMREEGKAETGTEIESETETERESESES